MYMCTYLDRWVPMHTHRHVYSGRQINDAAAASVGLRIDDGTNKKNKEKKDDKDSNDSNNEKNDNNSSSEGHSGSSSKADINVYMEICVHLCGHFFFPNDAAVSWACSDACPLRQALLVENCEARCSMAGGRRSLHSELWAQSVDIHTCI